jgi:hypothetical protein
MSGKSGHRYFAVLLLAHAGFEMFLSLAVFGGIARSRCHICSSTNVTEINSVHHRSTIN